MKQMNLPKMSTVKPPKQKSSAEEVGVCTNLLAQQFNQPAPNLIWVCDFTYVRVGTRFFYLCVILDLYARKVIACQVGKRIDSLHMVQSFSAKGHPYDNAVMECFFKYLKNEELNRRHFQSMEQLKQSLVSYIAGFYNPIRPHSHNHDLSPNQMEDRYFANFTCPLY